MDCTITFEELQALFDAKDIDLSALQGVTLNRASSYGRGFGRCGGLSGAVEQALKELKVPESDFKLQAVSCSGLADCKAALLKASKGILKENFIEGMACESGCIGGPACLSHGAKNRLQFSKYERLDVEKTISDSIENLELDEN